MATIAKQSIYLNLRPGSVMPVLHVSQGDSGLEALEFKLINGSQPWPIPAAVTDIQLNGATPVGVFSYNDPTWTGNTVTANVTETMTAEKGVVICELRLLDATLNSIGTLNFVISVEPSPYMNAHVSTSDMAVITAALNTAQQNLLLSKSWAVGDTGMRDGEDTNNSKYWSEVSDDNGQRWAIGSVDGTAVPSSDPAYHNNSKWWSSISESWAIGGTGDRAGEDTNNSKYWSTISHQYANEVSYKKVYESVAEMKADDALVDGQICRTLGYYAANDGGGALYQMHATQPATYSESITNGLYAELIFESLVTPEMFGAKGDGANDDTNAFQFALNSGKTVICRRGATYRFTNSIIPVNNQEVDFNGSTVAYEIINRETPTNMIVNLSMGKNVRIHGGRFTTDYASKLDYYTQVVGIHGDGAQYCEVYDMYFENLGVPNTPNGSIQVTFGLDGASTSDCHDNYVHDCTFDAVYDSFGVRFASAWLTVYPYEVYGNVAERNLFINSIKSCIEIAGNTTHHCKAINNTVLDCGTEAMDIDKNAHYCEMRGNYIAKCSGSEEAPDRLPYGGISVQTFTGANAISGYWAHDNVIAENVIADTGGAGVFIKAMNCKVIGNIVKKAQVGIIMSMHTAAGVSYYPDGIIQRNTITSSVRGIQLEGANDVIASDNIVNCNENAIYAANGQTAGTLTIRNNIIHYGNHGLYATAVQNEIIFDGNILHNDLTHDGASRGVFTNMVNRSVKIRKNRFVDADTVINMTLAGNVDEIWIEDNDTKNNANMSVTSSGGTFTVGILATRHNSAQVLVSAITANMQLYDDRLRVFNLTPASASMTNGSRHSIVASGSVASIVYAGSVSGDISFNTVLFELSNDFSPVQEQMIYGQLVKADDTTVVVPMLVKNDNKIYAFRNIPKGTIYIAGTYVVKSM